MQQNVLLSYSLWNTILQKISLYSLKSPVNHYKGHGERSSARYAWSWGSWNSQSEHSF